MTFRFFGFLLNFTFGRGRHFNTYVAPAHLRANALTDISIGKMLKPYDVKKETLRMNGDHWNSGRMSCHKLIKLCNQVVTGFTNNVTSGQVC